jgi:hypothetical protein
MACYFHLVLPLWLKWIRWAGYVEYCFDICIRGAPLLGEKLFSGCNWPNYNTYQLLRKCHFAFRNIVLRKIIIPALSLRTISFLNC